MIIVPHEARFSGWRVDGLGTPDGRPYWNSMFGMTRWPELYANYYNGRAAVAPIELIGGYRPSDNIAESRCFLYDHEAPDPRCSCGYRVVPTVDDASDYFRRSRQKLTRFSPIFDLRAIFVEVYGYGRVVRPVP